MNENFEPFDEWIGKMFNLVNDGLKKCQEEECKKPDDEKKEECSDIRDADKKQPKIPVNICEFGNTYIVEVYVPGFEKSQLNLEVRNNDLVIRGEFGKIVPNYILQEKELTSFVRKVKIPNEVDITRIGANYVSGVLYVSLPKIKRLESGRIKIDIKEE